MVNKKPAIEAGFLLGFFSVINQLHLKSNGCEAIHLYRLAHLT